MQLDAHQHAGSESCENIFGQHIISTNVLDSMLLKEMRLSAGKVPCNCSSILPKMDPI